MSLSGSLETLFQPTLLVVVQATYQFGVAHFSLIDNLGCFVEMFFANEGFPFVYVMYREKLNFVLRVYHLKSVKMYNVL